ncbi:MAG: flagellar biosynthesis protein FlaG [Deltaproteobacteria bacterium RIFOXYA12_FULL_61_11]|nr:MAG: flagellar biosynthesis protein FlaG [Deltaproteobacteria bacterium RIFOXYA12_FULL_61_11]
MSFQVDDRSEKVVIKVIDKESNEVIRQIPSEEVVALRERVEHLRGMLFNQKV